MNDNEGTRNFETVQNVEKRAPANGNKDPKKKIVIAIFATVIAIVLLFCAIIITEVVYKVNGDRLENDADSNEVDYKTTTKSSSDVNKGYLLSINAESDMEFKASVESIVPDSEGNPYYISNNVDYPSDKLVTEAADGLKKLANAYYEKYEARLLIAYAYDTGVSAVECEHVLGTVADIKKFVSIASTGKIQSEALSNTELTWLKDNCAKYGFIVSLSHSDGSTQIRYVGIAHATYIMKKGSDFSTYLDEIKEYDSEEPLSIKGADGKNYSVYFVKSTGDETKVTVPSNYNYEISGNNIDGFIITVNLAKKK